MQKYQIYAKNNNNQNKQFLLFREEKMICPQSSLNLITSEFIRDF